MKRSLLIYGLMLGMLLLLLRVVEYHFLVMQHTWEIYAGLLALLFTVLGIWMGGKLKRPKTVIVEKVQEATPVERPLPDPQKIRELGISTRELEVLQAMAGGYSNQEIADQKKALCFAQYRKNPCLQSYLPSWM